MLRKIIHGGFAESLADERRSSWGVKAGASLKRHLVLTKTPELVENKRVVSLTAVRPGEFTVSAEGADVAMATGATGSCLILTFNFGRPAAAV